jgi:predicted dehydrogenase
MTQRLRAALIGAGFMGDVHSRAIQRAGGILTVVASSTLAKSAAAASRYLAERSATPEEAATDDDVDVVHICTPNAQHQAIAELAFAAGKHVVCEKPLATDLASAQAMAASATRSGLIGSVPFVYRFYPTVREARGRIAAGELGGLHVLHGSYLQDWLSRPEDDNWRVDPALGGPSRAFADIGVHWCDMAEFVSGHRITRVSARMKTAYDTRVKNGQANEDVAVIQFETDLGALGSAVISQVSPGRKNRLWFSLDGEKGAVSFDQELPETLWLGGRDVNQIVHRAGETNTYGTHLNRVPVGHPQGYQDCFDLFVADTYAAIVGNMPDGLPLFADGLRAAVITDAVITSAATQSWVDVPAPI